MEDSIGKKIFKIGCKAVKEAQENNRKKGIPNVYCINGKIIYELPNGEITTEYDLDADIEKMKKEKQNKN